MAGPDIITTAAHMVNNCISIDTNTSSTASLNQIAKFLSGSVTSRKLVRYRLIVEPPWVKLSILRPFI
jgi:hypothetical protein